MCFESCFCCVKKSFLPQDETELNLLSFFIFSRLFVLAYVVFVVVVVILFFCVVPFGCCGINSVFYSIPFDVAKLSVDIIELLDV